MIQTIQGVNRRDELVKGIYVWIGQFEKEVSNSDLFSQFVDELVKLKWTMSERFATAEHLAGYYKQMSGESPPEFDLKRLFDWTREGYDPRQYIALTWDEMKHRTEKYEQYAFKTFGGQHEVDTMLIADEKKRAKHKGPMVPWSCPWDKSEEY